MELTEATTLLWTRRLVALAVIQQTIELLQLRSAWSDEGPWNWGLIRQEFTSFPKPALALLDVLMPPAGFTLVLGIQLGAGVALLAGVTPIFPPLLLLFTSALICLRWRGAFNGGSDFMTLVVLTGLGAASFSGMQPGAARLGLAWIAAQSLLSYFLSGASKLRSARWRTGQALPAILGSPRYGVPPSTRDRLDSPPIAWAAGWLVLTLECAFPLALAHPLACLGLMSCALVFHLANVHLFGLNRFVLAWLATYPALLFFSLR